MGIKTVKERVISQIPVYLFSETLAMLASFLSFPFFTRVFSKSDYGIISLVNLTIILVTTIADCGMRQALFRYYEENSKPDDAKTLLSTLFFGSSTFSIIGGVIFYVAGLVLFAGGVIEYSYYIVLSVASFLIVVRVINNLLIGIVRIQEKIITCSVYSVISKFGGIILAIILIHYYSLGVVGFFLGLVVAELCVSCVLIVPLFINHVISAKYFRLNNLVKFLTYGAPLIFVSLSTTLLNMGDRYVIGFFLGAASVATYTVAFSLVNYIQELVIKTVNSGMYPIIMNALARREDKQVKNLLEKYFLYYFMATVPIISLLLLLRKDIIILLASPRYIESAGLLPILVAGIMMSGLAFPFTISLYREKKTATIAKITLSAAILSLSLNFILIPFWGIKGSAVANFCCFLFNFLCFKFVSDKWIKLHISIKHVFKYIQFSLVMVGFILLLKINQLPLWLQLFIKISSGITIYLALLFFFENLFKKLLLSYLDIIKVKLGSLLGPLKTSKA